MWRNDKSHEGLLAPGEALVEKVGQHRHCKHCDRAIPYKDEFCDDKCSTEFKGTMQKKKRQLTYFYVIMVVIMIMAISLSFMG